MRKIFCLLAGAALLPVAAFAQDDGPRPDGPAPNTAECDHVPGRAREMCFDRLKRAAKDKPAEQKGGKGTKGLSKADATLVNDTNAAAKAKLDAGDFAGAVAEYQKGIDASPNNPAKHVLVAGLAMSLRRQGVALYNGGERPTPPPPGSSNDTIRAFNAAVAKAQTERTAAALPLIKRAMEAAANAATLADASTNKQADVAIGTELREDAYLLFKLDPRGTLAAARPSATLEADWLRRWLTATNPLAEQLAAKYGIAVAAALVAKDPAAGLALADEVKARSGNDADGAMGYAEIVVAARTPAGDPHRAQATAWLTAVEATVVDSQQKKRLGELKAALAATS